MKSYLVPLKVSLETCVCCGFATLEKLKSACSLCLWKEDGSDNETAFRYSQVNQTNLNLARHGYLTAKIKGRRNPSARFNRVRFFRVDESGGYIEERGMRGDLVYAGPIPFVDYADLGGNRIAAMPIGMKKRA